ncbi:MAG TPA: toll/interleukin-1 receptor domain-containing protein [Candidatus Deferrimicrobium sp.]|nr:toll/interleukin-1 receptor domain-containing protein [Candidatus Deferrimicrobium sp.]
MKENELGTAITVIDGEPRKFEVSYIVLQASSHDLTRTFPVAYVFQQTKPKGVRGEGRFIVKVTDEFVSIHFEKPDRSLHQQVAKFGLYSIRKEPTINEFILTTQKYQALEEQPKLTARSLSNAILDFIFRVNEVWPSESISIHDLCENLNSDRLEIQEWGNYLVDAKLLTIGTSKPSERWGESTRSYKINAAKRQEIAEELISSFHPRSERLRIFLSHSHHDLKTAKILKKGLEDRGIEVFLAHIDLNVSEQWRIRILQELQSCDAFLPLLSNKFQQSDWCDQETGIAFAKGKIVVPIRISMNPYGFIDDIQAKPFRGRDITTLCDQIVNVLKKRPELSHFFERDAASK